MIIHDLTVSKQKIFGADNISLAAHANETLALRFHFDRHWKMFDSKAAIFKNYSGQYYIIELHNNIVPVPWEVLTVDEDIEISVIAFEDETVLTTNKVLINVGESLLPEDYQTFSASETLFDRFKRECTAQAFSDYEDEIERLKTGYEERILALGNVINSKDNEINNAQTVKDAEIAQINQQHAEEVTALNSQIAELNSEKAGFKAKADKWDMVDNALQLKTSSAQTLWGNGTDLFALPMMNIPNATVITGSSISNNLTEVGFNLASISSLIEVFKDKSNLKKINLINTENITDYSYAFMNCSNLKEVNLGDITNANLFNSAFLNDTSLEKVSFGTNERISSLQQTFYGCSALKEINGEIFAEAITKNIDTTFFGCSNLEKLSFSENTIRVYIDLSYCTNLSKESMLNIFNGLCDEVSKTITVSRNAFNINFPTDEEKEEIYDFLSDVKGWSFSLG